MYKRVEIDYWPILTLMYVEIHISLGIYFTIKP